MKQKVLRIEPFGEANLKSCLLHGIFSIMNQYQRPIEPFLFNYTFKYGLSEFKENIKLYVEINQIRELSQLMKDLSVQVYKKGRSANIIDDIKRAIMEDRYVIVYADPYYMPGNAKYQLRHIIHCFLVYGFNDTEHTFEILDVVENPYPNGYERKTISYVGLMDTYNGYVENYSELGKETYFEYFAIEDEKDILIERFSGTADHYIHNFMIKMIQEKEFIVKGLEYLKAFILDYSRIVSDEGLLSENIEELYDTIHDIMFDKLTDKYRMLKLLNQDSEEITLLESIINRYIYIRAVLGRYKHTSIYNKKALIASINKLTPIYEYEVKYHELLFEEIENRLRLKAK
ncbi:hypothetical protein [Paenibacillus woosongensis]|uniref:Butirosin biosynthesis protein H N-terminal domain-containing protein n=1 Tax=Paenibacillus woosongensis TaxID=307580 RepID=A0A7X2Z0C2_9BACL|nr:hypothetical protein [Paenibacillus woosongensis]MUG45276.1 hypothetical protein [Paenibacillus woosongensis]